MITEEWVYRIENSGDNTLVFLYPAVCYVELLSDVVKCSATILSI